MRRIAYTDRNSDGNCNGYGNSRGKCDADSYVYRDGNGHSNPDTSSYCDAYRETQSHTEASTNAVAKAVSPKLARL